MKSSRKEILKYEYDKESEGENIVSISLDGRKDAKSLLEDTKQLVADGYLIEPVKTVRQINLKLTDKGWDFVENGFEKGVDVMSVGDNNIIINGNSNVVKDNYNNIKMEIAGTDLTAEQKQQIVEFLDEIKRARETEPNSKIKVRSIVENFVLGITSNVAAAPLIELISSIVSNM